MFLRELYVLLSLSRKYDYVSKIESMIKKVIYIIIKVSIETIGNELENVIMEISITIE